MKKNVNYIKAIFLAGLFCFSSTLMLYSQKPKSRIIIWDVTSSMVGTTNSVAPNFGYNKNSDIDQIVRDAIIKIIKDSQNDNGGFTIMPFGSDILDEKYFENNPSGRDAAGKYVREYVIEKKPKGYTNICGAWDKAMGLIGKDKQYVMYIFTDGSQNIAFGGSGTDCLSSIVNKYCELSNNTENFTFFISLNVVNSTFSSVLNNACSKHLKYIPLSNVKNDGINLPISLGAKFNPIIINLQDPSLGTTERFKMIGGKLPKGIRILAQLETTPQQQLDIKCAIKSINDDKVDVLFTLEDVSGSTISNLKNISKLNINGTIKLSCSDNTVSFEPADIQLKVINKKPQQLNFTIK